jgi:hypothetical protein
VDARHKAGHDGGEAVRFTRHGRAFRRVSLSSSCPRLSPEVGQARLAHAVPLRLAKCPPRQDHRR